MNVKEAFQCLQEILRYKKTMLFFVNCALLFYYFASLCPYFVDFSNATYIVSNTTPSSLLTSSFSSRSSNA